MTLRIISYDQSIATWYNVTNNSRFLLFQLVIKDKLTINDLKK